MASQRRLSAQRPVGGWDHVARGLHALREAAGHPSYAELGRRVVRGRMAEGQTQHEAHVATSSVHDCFRLGRTRLNLGLLEDVVLALEADPALVRGWVEQPVPPVETDPITPEPEPEPEPDTAPEPEAPVPSDLTARPGTRQIVLVLVGCVLLNLLGRGFVDLFALPVHLDMVGTAIAALALGPWRGAAVGLTTNVLGIVGSGLVSLPFALVNVVGALVWGYGVRRLDLGRSLPRFFGLCLLTAAACSAVAVPILAVVYGVGTPAGHGSVTTLVVDVLGPSVAALGVSNLMTSTADKVISGFVALVAISMLPLVYRRAVPLVAAAPRAEDGAPPLTAGGARSGRSRG